MVVTAGTQYDTIGGGNLEFTCLGAARAMLEGSEGPVLRDFPLGPELGQCCGGNVSVLFEPLRPSLLHVALFGAGHVGRALVALLEGLRVRVTWIDTRADLIEGAPASVRTRHTDDPAREVASLPAGTLVLVMTHDHQIDFGIVAAALTRDDFVGVGLIGSDTKRVRFARRLARLGLAPEAIGRLICPIGIPGVGGKLPAEIAISVAAQILRTQQQIIEKGTMPMPAQDTRLRLVRAAAAADCGDCTADCDRHSPPWAASA
jgi:xanthine dehydrogenase accessory factor